MLELVLILPIILLVLMILYQVSIMMTTYQALRTTTFNASMAFSKADTSYIKTNVENAISTSIANYYFGSPTAVTCATSSTGTSGWTTDAASTAYVVKYRLLTSADDGASWTYYDPTAATPAEIPFGRFIAVELKLENADDAFPGYWILAHFIGVDAVKSETMVLSQVTTKGRVLK